MANNNQASLDQYKYEIASELGVTFGNRFENREKPCGYFGQVGGEMVRRALASQFGGNSGAAVPNQNAFYTQTAQNAMGVATRFQQ
jgi:hypothetical protein